MRHDDASLLQSWLTFERPHHRSSMAGGVHPRMKVMLAFLLMFAKSQAAQRKRDPVIPKMSAQRTS